jgi:hypothetical protein
MATPTEAPNAAMAVSVGSSMLVIAPASHQPDNQAMAEG